MPTYHPHTLVAFGGILNAAAPDKEIWQCGVRVVSGGGGNTSLADPAGYMAAVTPLLSSWFIDPGPSGGSFADTAVLSWLKVNNIGANGHYSDPGAVNIVDYPGGRPGAGSNVAGSAADILCMAISWGTAKAVRKGSYASHGRIYPPNYYGLAGSRMRNGANIAWAARGKALLELLAVAPFNAVPVVCSPHAGEFEPITHVRVGDVIDVQRRRKSALKETYSTLPFP